MSWFDYYEDRRLDPDHDEYAGWDDKYERMLQEIDDAWEREMDAMWE